MKQKCSLFDKSELGDQRNLGFCKVKNLSLKNMESALCQRQGFMFGLFPLAISFSPRRSFIAKSSKNTQGNNVHGQLTYFRGILLIVRGGDAIATSKAVKTRSLCAAHKSQFSLVPGNNNFLCTCHILILCS